VPARFLFARWRLRLASVHRSHHHSFGGGGRDRSVPQSHRVARSQVKIMIDRSLRKKDDPVIFHKPTRDTESILQIKSMLLKVLENSGVYAELQKRKKDQREEIIFGKDQKIAVCNVQEMDCSFPRFQDQETIQPKNYWIIWKLAIVEKNRERLPIPKNYLVIETTKSGSFGNNRNFFV
jgi:hypothetical protein